jgi:hypothetical protein
MKAFNQICESIESVCQTLDLLKNKTLSEEEEIAVVELTKFTIILSERLVLLLSNQKQ